LEISGLEAQSAPLQLWEKDQWLVSFSKRSWQILDAVNPHDGDAESWTAV
jgi:hypothetical protein